MAIYSIKETFVEVPTKANSALNSHVAYYKLILFRFIAKTSYGLIIFLISAFASLLVLLFLSLAVAYFIGEALNSGFFYCRSFLYIVIISSFIVSKEANREVSITKTI